MNTYEKFYRENLYPFQDGILKIVKERNTPFYLTGGTALGRHYYNHRFSDDLDFFVNDNPRFHEYVDAIMDDLSRQSGVYNIDEKKIMKFENYVKAVVAPQKGDLELKIDFVNDIPFHCGGFESNGAFGRVDGIMNILTNKVSALYRYEPKDIADLWFISRNYRFFWPDIIVDSKKKEAGVDPIVVHEVLRSFPESAFTRIKWAVPVHWDLMSADINAIAADILNGSMNSLCR